MPKTCCVFGCSSRGGRDRVKFYRLPLRNPALLQLWIQKMRTETVRVNTNTRVCSKHFVGGEKNGPNDIPSVFPWRDETPRRRPPRERSDLPSSADRQTLENADTEARGEDEETDSCSHRTSDAGGAEGQSESPIVQLSITEQLQEQVTKLVIQLKEKEEVEAKLKEDLACQQQLASNLAMQNKALENDTRLSFEMIKHDKELVRFYTGFPDADTFYTLFASLQPFFDAGLVRSSSTYRSGEHHVPNPRTPLLSKEDELFLTLVRLRLGAPLTDLAFRFKIHTSTVSRIFTTYLDLLFRHFEVMESDFWPSRAQIDANMPDEFKRHYPSTRCVVDCTEIMIEKPSDPDLQRATWSSYKNHNTFKCLLAITPDGCLSFVSELYGGSVSDREIVESCKFLDLIEPGDSVMADKGFKVKDLLERRGATLNIPPYLEKKDQLSHEETIVTRRIAKLRIHVERQMERVKNFHILDFLPISLCDITNKIFFVCAWLTQFQPPLCP